MAMKSKTRKGQGPDLLNVAPIRRGNRGGSASGDILLRPIKRRDIVGEVVTELEGLIATLKPGERLPPEREICDRLGVGRSSVREAVRLLSFVGVLETRQGDGIYVRQPDIQPIVRVFELSLRLGYGEVGDFIEARQMIETETAARAAQKRSEEDLAVLHQSVDQMRKLTIRPAEAGEWDLAFHEAVARACRNFVIGYMAAAVHGMTRKWIGTTFAMKGIDIPTIITEHEAVVDAIAARDNTRAREAMAYHLMQAAERLRSALRMRERLKPGERKA
jgi:GntR family transcriptional repressor for pyruvate dehydrogenase complex